MHKFYQGTLRPKIKPLGPCVETGMFQFEVEWIDSERDQMVWQETINVPPGHAAFSQIQCTGYFQPQDGCFIDEHGKRHFVMRAEPGKLGVPFG